MHKGRSNNPSPLCPVLFDYEIKLSADLTGVKKATFLAISPEAWKFESTPSEEFRNRMSFSVSNQAN